MSATGQMPPMPGDDRPRRRLHVGLVNNAAGGGLQQTERRFAQLLRRADPRLDVRLWLFRSPEIARSRSEAADLPPHYQPIAELFRTPLDALIVTGMEPREAALQNEPVWADLTRVADWAEDCGVPTIWSCLAAHAAVLHLDGVGRSRFPTKLSGVFGCDVLRADHPLMRGLPPRISTPHSRYYGLREDRMVDAGYDILSRSEAAGVDAFFRCRRAPFVFFQGHPEYDPDTLLREYRRDVRRYLAGAQAEFPTLPARYFDPAAEPALSMLAEHVVRDRSAHALDSLLAALDAASVADAWLQSADRLCANWLAAVADREPASSGAVRFKRPVRREAVPELAGAEAGAAP